MSFSKMQKLTADNELVNSYNIIEINWRNAETISLKDSILCFDETFKLLNLDTSLLFIRGHRQYYLKCSVLTYETGLLDVKKYNIPLIERLKIKFLFQNREHNWSFNKKYKPSTLINVLTCPPEK
jgi:hypothetical protein